MKFVFTRVLCTLLALLIGIPPTLVAAHDFGGTTNAGGAPGSDLDRDKQKNQTAGGEISLFDGAESFDTTDLTVKGIFPLVVSRTYDSRSTYDSPLGYGWDHSYNIRLFTYADGSVVIRWSTGLKNRFVYTGSAYVNETDSMGQLIENGDGTFTFFTHMGIHYEFDVNGNLSLLKDTNDNYQSFTYTSDKRPLTGISPFSADSAATQIVSYSFQLLKIEEGTVDGLTGRYIDFTYDAGTGRLASVSDFSGRIISYLHDPDGNLIRVNYPENLFHSFSYGDINDIHNITNFIKGYKIGLDEFSNVLYENVYDDQDRVIQQNHAGGNLQIEYTIPMAKTTVTRTVLDDQQVLIHTYQNVYEFNSNGYLERFTDEIGNQTAMIRDSKNNILRRITWENQGTVSAPNLHEHDTTNYTYDADSNRIGSQMTLDDGEVLSWEYTFDHGWLESSTLSSNRFPDKAHKVLHEFNHNSDGYPKYITIKRVLAVDGGIPEYITTTFSHNSYGQLTGVAYANGDNETTSYTDGFVTERNGLIMARSADRRGNVVEFRDATGNHTTFTYDTFDRPVQLTNPLGEDTLLTWQGWNLVEIETGKTATQPGQKVLVTYDKYDRVTSHATRLDATVVSTTTFSYDSSDNILSVGNGSSETVTYTFDAKNRVKSAIFPNEETILYAYDVGGNIARVADSENGETLYSFDDYNRLLLITTPLNEKTTYSYEFNTISKIIDARGKVQQFSYDLAGRLSSATNPLGHSEHYVYDTKGRTIEHTDKNGLKTSYTYNASDLVTNITIHSDPVRHVDFSYDDIGNILTYRDTDISTDPAYSYTYDSRNRIDTENNLLINKTLDYDYTPHGKLKQLSLRETGGTTLFDYSYSYDDAGRLTGMEESSTNHAQFSHDVQNRLTNITYFNGITGELSYDDQGQIQEINYQKSNSTLIENYQYQYDDMGRLTRADDNNGTTSYSYDTIGRLVGATYPTGSGLAGETYSYDETGNRLSSSDFSDWTYDDRNALTHVGATDFSYDQNGNMSTSTESGQTTNFNYDGFNRLTGINKPGLSSTYTYDLANRRIKKETNGATQWYMYDKFRPIAEFDNAGNLVRHYGYFPESPTLLSITDSAGTHAVLNDRLAVPRMATSPTEEILWSGDYQAFGGMVQNENVDGDSNSFQCNMRFPGQYYDEESTLYYNSFRFYDSSSGRFTSVDPIVSNFYSPGDLNSYTYGYNNPLGYIDPDGRETLSQFWDTIRFFPGEFWNTRENFTAAINGKMGSTTQLLTAGFTGVAIGATLVAIVAGAVALVTSSAAAAAGEFIFALPGQAVHAVSWVVRSGFHVGFQTLWTLGDIGMIPLHIFRACHSTPASMAWCYGLIGVAGTAIGASDMAQGVRRMAGFDKINRSLSNLKFPEPPSMDDIYGGFRDIINGIPFPGTDKYSTGLF